MAGANVNICNASDDAPLQLAIKGGHAGVAKDLLLSGADHSAMDSKGFYPLYLAAKRGQTEAARALVQKGANLERVDCVEHLTALGVAVCRENVSMVEVLLAGGARADARMGADCETALHIAARFNKPASIPALVEGGATIDLYEVDGATPLHSSAF